MNDLKIFGGPANVPLTQDICRYLNLPVGKISMGRFPDGEISCKIDEDVRGRDVFIIQPTCPPVNDHLMELLVMIDSFKRASSYRLTAVIPYFGYARQDRKDSGRVPITGVATSGTGAVAYGVTGAGADELPGDRTNAAVAAIYHGLAIAGVADAEDFAVFKDHFATHCHPDMWVGICRADAGKKRQQAQKDRISTDHPY